MIMLIVVLIVVWWFIGSYIFYYWWTKEYDLTKSDLHLLFLSGVLGLTNLIIMPLVFWFTDDNQTVFKRRK